VDLLPCRVLIFVEHGEGLCVENSSSLNNIDCQVIKSIALLNSPNSSDNTSRPSLFNNFFEPNRSKTMARMAMILSIDL
jgi:hypothetical protein